MWAPTQAGTVDNPSGTFDAFIEWDTLNDTLEVTTTSVDFAFTTEFKVDGPYCLRC